MVPQISHKIGFFTLTTGVKYALLCMTTLLLSACEPKDSIRHVFESYQKKFESITRIELSVADVNRHTISYPKTRDLAIHIHQQTINFRQFFKLSHCQLNRLIGEHNSTLNRNQGPSEELFFDLAFIANAKLCMVNSEENQHSTSKISVEKLAETKLASLDERSWNASIASTEFSRFFSVYVHLPSRVQLTKPAQNTSNAIKFLGDYLGDVRGKANTHRDFSADRSRFDKSLGALHKDRYAGKVLLAMKVALIYVEAINEKLSILKGNENCAVLREQALKEFRRNLNNDVNIILVGAETVRSFIDRLKIGQSVGGKTWRAYWQEHWSGPSSTYSKLTGEIEEHRQLSARLISHCRALLN